MPQRNTPEYYAHGGDRFDASSQGDDSLLHQELVQKRGMTGKRQRPASTLLGNGLLTTMGRCLFINQLRV